MGFGEGIGAGDAAHAIMELWNAWADEIEKIFLQMTNQAEELDVPQGDLLRFLRRFKAHAPRPALSPPEEDQESQERLLRTLPYLNQTRLHWLWNAWADSIEETYIDMACTLAQCSLRDDAEEAFGMASLSLSTRPLLPTHRPPLSRGKLDRIGANRQAPDIDENELVKIMGCMDLDEEGGQLESNEVN